MVKVLVKKLDPAVQIPSYKTLGSSGMDLMAFIKEPIKLASKKSCLVPTGISIAMSEDYEIQIRPRSGLAAKNNISVLNTPGTIDSDYRGELKIILFNHGKEEFIIKNNDRIAQMVLAPVHKIDFEEVENLPEMKKQLKKNLIERFSRQIVLKDIGILGQKKILSAKVLVVGIGGLGCPAVEFLTRAGVGSLGIVDYDKVSLSNLHRQSLYEKSDVGKSKVLIANKILRRINPHTKIQSYNLKLNNINFKKIISKYDYIVDGSDNFKTKFLLNDFCLKYKKFLVTGAISKFDGHIFSFDFKNKKLPCLRCFFQGTEPSGDLLNCEAEGILGTVAGIVGTLQANEILKKILNIKKSLNGYILILNLLDLNFRKVKIKKDKVCICNK